MESKIPKRPALKTMIPSDRIKVNALNHETHTSCSSLHRVGRDVANLPNPRSKLRRSRSACDIAFRRNENALPPKLPRLIENKDSTTASTSSTSRFRNVANTTETKVNLKATTTANNIKNRPPEKHGTNQASTTGAPKPPKRIPPYDFKARYHDLLEKFNSLKERFQQKSEQLNSLEDLPDRFEANQTELVATKEELKKMTASMENYKCTAETLQSKLESTSKMLTTTTEELETLKEKYEMAATEIAILSKKNIILAETNSEITERIARRDEELRLRSEMLFRFNVERKALHNSLMDLRGNIRVFCRVRPPLPCEKKKPLCGWNYIDENTVEILNHDLIRKNKPGAYTFSFDHVFNPGCEQDEIFEHVSPLIQSAMDGYNICIFAYGQTGSGKTYTMDGTDSNIGVIPRTVDLIFQSIENYRCLGWKFTIKATFLEIYNEILYDLLSNERKDMEIRMVKNQKNEIYVSNITEETVLSADHLRELMEISKMNRATAATIGNERSSRSHAVTRIELIGYHADKNETSIGTVNLVDLAGSESPKTSIRMNETKNINRSLSELTNVILSLLQKQDHIPYRNSKLTHLLMPALGGNSKTLMFINVSPFLDCYVESLKSLRFASSVNSCKLVKAKRNRFVNSANSNESL